MARCKIRLIKLARFPIYWSKYLTVISRFLLFCSMVFILLARHSLAADINLTIHQESIDNNVFIRLNNDSPQSVFVDSVNIVLNQKHYDHPYQDIILPQENINFPFQIKYPSLSGSYALVVTVRYFNESDLVSLRHVGRFNFMESSTLNSSCLAEDATFDKVGELAIWSKQPALWSLVLPEKITIDSVSTFPDHRIYHVQSMISGLRNRYPYFAIAENTIEGKHRFAMCNGTVVIGKNPNSPFQMPTMKGRMPSEILFALGALFLFASYYLLMIRKSKTLISQALGKYTSRMFLVTTGYYILKNGATWLDSTIKFIDWEPYRYFASAAVENLNGPNYEYFFIYFVDFYLGVCLIMTFPYLYYVDSDRSFHEDKYASLLMFCFSTVGLFKGKGVYRNNISKLGFLTVCVKIFYIPLLISWVINNTIHQTNITHSFTWDLYTINAYLVALFIYLDTIIYGFGYLVESRLLKNEIKSVEPTIFGWLVCLWCYPPFNLFSFRIFDVQLYFAYAYPFWVDVIMTCIITVLWGIFVWASLALGFKASNLTNRGIVRSGPYRFVRHPAYAAKLIIWYIQGIFFGQFGIGILIGFTLIYILRAWTEERHLSRDPDYQVYKKAVPWKIVPRII